MEVDTTTTGYTWKWTQRQQAIPGSGHKEDRLYLEVGTKIAGCTWKLTQRRQAIPGSAHTGDRLYLGVDTKRGDYTWKGAQKGQATRGSGHRNEGLCLEVDTRWIGYIWMYRRNEDRIYLAAGTQRTRGHKEDGLHMEQKQRGQVTPRRLYTEDRLHPEAGR